MTPRRPTTPAALAILVLSLLAAAPAQAGLMDFLFGRSAPPDAAAPANPAQRQWRIGEFTAIRLVEREAGAPANQHPAALEPELLRRQLALVRVAVRSGTQPLFAADELAELIEPLSQALAVAGPGDDVLLLSTARRDGVLVAPLGITARLFVHSDALQLVVNDARLDFVNAYRGSRIEPEFSFGSRDKPGTARLQSSAASARRPDWLALPVAMPAPPAAPAAVAAPAVPPAAAAPSRAAVAPAAATPPAAAAPARPRDAAFADEVEQRLNTLKRLRERGLITEDEYQQKRREILALL